MRKRLLVTLCLIVLSTAVGCGDQGEKGRNKGLDVPKPAANEPAE